MSKQAGETIRIAGPFRIVESLSVYLSGKSEVDGYSIIGPDTDPSWLYTLKAANAEVDKLFAARPS
ncbi:MAG: hypothetical protein ABW049_09135 [Spongiibacteraceae bacterium]